VSELPSVLAGIRVVEFAQNAAISLLGTAMSLGTPLLGIFEGDQARLDELDADMAILQAAGLDFDAQRDLYESRVQAGGGAFQLYFRHYRTADGLISLAGLWIIRTSGGTGPAACHSRWRSRSHGCRGPARASPPTASRCWPKSASSKRSSMI